MDSTNYKFRLFSGHLIPMVGFGTYTIRGSDLIQEVLDFALGAGYRLIDTAYVYNNEQDIGIALKTLLPKYNLRRQDIFITSKLPPSHHGDRVAAALTTSLKNLGCNYIDLYLIHWPGQAHTSVKDPSNVDVRTKTWQHLIQAKKSGLVRDIGVSNYNMKHMSELLRNCYGEMPAVNQIEWHPHYHQIELLEYCQKHGILLQAYSSLGGTNNSHLISDAAVVNIAQKLNKSPAQVLLKWALQQNIAIIPKGRSKEHIVANINLDFDIPETDMLILSNIRTTRKYAWDPDEVL
ncbi:Aldo/keto reductase family [Popillia japonica]|uniref:Aldo/keto reductase family n=1 Tax=Popillia japonica TaxID=7064 RepID=A0AAW1LV59_POPJA